MRHAFIVVSAIVIATVASRPATPAPHHAFVPQDREAKALFSEFCKKCHGVLGTPPQTMKKKYEKIATFDAKFLEKHTEDSIVTILNKGKGEDMEAVKDKLSASEIRALAKYVRELAGRPKPGGGN